MAPPALQAAAVNWVPDADGNWSTTSNWSSSPALPGAADNVTLDVGGATVRTITHSVGTDTVLSLTSQENLSLTGGSLTVSNAYTNAQNTTISGTLSLNGSSSLVSLTQTAGTLSGTGNVTVTGAATLNGGLQTGAATTALQAGGSIGGSFNLDAQRVLQNQGALNWTAGNIELNISSSGGAGRIDNAAGAVFNAQSNNSLTATGYADLGSVPGFGMFNNGGTFRKSVGTGTTSVSAAFNNTGTVDVQTGTLYLSGGGTSTGGQFQGAGTLQLAGTHTLDAASNLATNNLTLSSGTTTVNGGYNVAGTTTINGGTLALNGASTLGALTQTAGTLSGTGNTTVIGAATLSGSGMQTGAATTVLQAGGSIGGSFSLDAQRVLQNQGSLNWTAGNIDLNGGSTGGAGRIDNAVGAVFNAQGNNSLTATAYADLGSVPGFGVFNNGGTFRKSVGTGTTSVSAAFNNTGTVDVQTGTLHLSGGSTSTGGQFQGAGTLQLAGTNMLDAASNLATNNLTLTSGTTTVNGGYNVTGTTAINGGTLALNGAYTLGALTQTAGTLSGTDNVTVTGAATLNGGTQTGAATTVLQAGGGIGGSFYLDAQRVLQNQGTLNWTAGTIDLNGGSTGGAGRIDNAAGAVFNAQGNNTLQATTYADLGSVPGFGVFNNDGTFRKSVGTGTTSVSVAFNNTGTVDVQTGTLYLSAGSTNTGAHFQGAGTLQLAGTHTLDAASSLATANLTLSSGTTTVNGDYNVAGTTTINSGTANLVGTLTSLGSTVNLNAGSLNTAANGFSVANFTQTGGTLSGTGNATLTGAATLNGGTQTGAATTVLQAGGSIGGSFYLDAQRVLWNQGTLNWTAGNIELNSSTSGGAGRIDNAAGAVFNAQGNNTLIATGYADLNSVPGFGVFNNDGIFRKSVGTGTTTVSAVFNNTGTVDVQTGTLYLSIGSTNTGAHFQGAGTLQLAGTHTLDAASSLATNNVTFSGGATTVNGDYNVAGTTTVNGGTANLVGTLTNLGNTVAISSGTLNTAAHSYSVANFSQTGGTLSGTGNVTLTGAATLGGTQTGAATTVLQAGGGIGGGFSLDAQRVLRNQGTLNWTGGNIDLNVSTSGGAGRIDNAAGAVFNVQSNNSLVASAYADLNSVPGFGVFNNDGTFRKSAGASTTTVSAVFNNTGTVDVQTGTLYLSAGSTNTGAHFQGAGTLQLAGTNTLDAASSLATNNVTFSGGTTTVNGDYNVAGTTTISSGGTANLVGTLTSLGNTVAISSGTLNTAAHSYSVTNFTQTGGTLSGTGNATVTGAASLNGGLQTGAATTVLQTGGSIGGSFSLDAQRVLQNQGTLNWTAGAIELNGSASGGAGRIDNAAGAVFNAQGNNTLIATAYADLNSVPGFGVFNNDGIFRKSAGTGLTTVSTVFNNSGTVDAQSGTLSFNSGIQGSAGSLNIASGGAVTLGAASTVGSVSHGGTGATSLSLGANNLTVSGDYDNANFGSGNGFNARAHVSGTGQIKAAGDVAQAVVGANVSNGATATPTLTFGNVRLGGTTLNYQVANTGSTGPSLRGAIQTSVNGGNISDGRLSGAGVSAANFGAVGAGAASGNLGVTLTVNSAGVYSPLVGQKVALVNNFDNVADQVLNINSQAGAAAYRLASPTLNTGAVTLAARVGDAAPVAGVSVTNTSPDIYTEGLKAGFGPLAAGFTSSGAIANLAAGQTDAGSLTLALDTSSAGSYSGTAQLNFASTGAGTTGEADASVGTGTVNLTGKVYTQAVAQVGSSSVDFGVVHVGDTVAAHSIAVANAAAATALNDTLQGSFSTSGAHFSGTGNLGAGLAAGQGGSFAVGLDTSSAGVFSGTATLGFASHNADMADLALGTAAVGLSAQVNNYANPEFTKLAGAGSLSGGGLTFTLDFGNVLQHSGVLTAELSLRNGVDGPADWLDGFFDVFADHFALSGFNAFTGITASQSQGGGLFVNLDTAFLGGFSDHVLLTATGRNASGYAGNFNVTLNLVGNVILPDGSPVPEPGSLTLFAIGLLAGGRRQLRRLATHARNATPG